jgi:glutaminase
MHSPDLEGRVSRDAAISPLHRFLIRCHAELQKDYGGALADYIPELKKANPNPFGVSLATIDGHVYEVGDSGVLFTIQSISKAFVFALALELLGAEKVEAVIGVEPSGDAFNSIRLRPDNRPFNPMVNSGAIACSGLIHQAKGQRCVRMHPRGAWQLRRPRTRRRRAGLRFRARDRRPQSRHRLFAAQLRGHRR